MTALNEGLLLEIVRTALNDRFWVRLALKDNTHGPLRLAPRSHVASPAFVDLQAPMPQGFDMVDEISGVASDGEFRSFAQAMPNHVWAANPAGVLYWFNDRVYEYGGHAPGSLDGTGWITMVHPDDRAVTGERWAAALAAGTTYETEFRLQRADGSHRWHLARAVPIRSVEGAITRWIGTNTDIEEQKLTSQALQDLATTLEQRVERQTRERDRLWRTSRDLLVSLNAKGTFVSVSPSVTDILGWKPEEMVGGNVLDFVVPDDVPLTGEALAHAARDVLPITENRCRHKDGGCRWLSWVAAPDGDLIFATGRHITTEKEQAIALAAAEDHLRQSQKMEAVGQLTGGLAHDFNNLLAGISGSLELMQVRLAQGRVADVDRYMNAAQGAARRAAALTHRLLAFSRRQTLDPKPTDVNRLIGGLDELIRRTIGPTIEMEVIGASGLWPALVDASQLENALLNLCINARDAMPDGGRLTIETANKWLDRQAARSQDIPEGQYLSLCVTDTGIGMAPDVVAKAFDPFFTTKPIGEGTGLGLSMIYGFAKQSGGQVRIYSELGEGSTVCIYLPRHHADVMEETVIEGTDLQRSEQSETVLIVDDEPTVRMLVTDVLQDLGYTVIEAADSVAGLKALQSNMRIDLLISDVGLPGGMNGRQMADAGRGTRPNLKVLFITGYAENAALGDGRVAHGMAVLTKPFPVETLASRVREMLEA